MKPVFIIKSSGTSGSTAHPEGRPFPFIAVIKYELEGCICM